MKKLIIATFAIAFGITTQAAMCQWSIYNEALEDAVTIYSFVGSGKAAEMAAYLVSGDYADASSFEKAISGYTADGVNDGGYVEGMADAGAGTDFSKISILFLDGKEVGDNVYVLSDVDVTGYTFEPGTQGPGMIDLSELSLSTAQVKFAETPEPTSGLLLLLGVAGLALRRRRA